MRQAELDKAVVDARKMLDPREVRRIRPTIGSNANGEPSIFFLILLTAFAIHPSRFASVTERISTTLVDQLQPYNQWGLLPYFNFTSDPAHFRDPGFM